MWRVACVQSVVAPGLARGRAHRAIIALLDTAARRISRSAPQTALGLVGLIEALARDALGAATGCAEKCATRWPCGLRSRFCPAGPRPGPQPAGAACARIEHVAPRGAEAQRPGGVCRLRRRRGKWRLRARVVARAADVLDGGPPRRRTGQRRRVGVPTSSGREVTIRRTIEARSSQPFEHHREVVTATLGIQPRSP